MSSSVYPSSFVDKMFEERIVGNLNDVVNGLSYVTDDLTISRFIVDVSNFDSVDVLNATSICNNFLQIYQNSYEKRMDVLLQYFIDQYNEGTAG